MSHTGPYLDLMPVFSDGTVGRPLCQGVGTPEAGTFVVVVGLEVAVVLVAVVVGSGGRSNRQPAVPAGRNMARSAVALICMTTTTSLVRPALRSADPDPAELAHSEPAR